MSEQEKNNREMSEATGTSVDAETESGGGEALETEKVASARDIPRPSTSLHGRPAKDVGKLVVSLLGEVSLIPDLEEVARTNEDPGKEGRTPVMTVIHSILKKNGGNMKIQELAVQTRTYWNRPFPASPYTPEEFIYVLVSNSDDLRVSLP
jgi:hypothetical protein